MRKNKQIQMKRSTAEKSTARPSRKKSKHPVTLVLGARKDVRQPESFRVCPLGMQLCSPHPLPQFEMLSFTIDTADTDNQPKQITCTGFVANCQPEKDSDLYRIWIKWMDLQEEDRQCIQRISKHTEHLCPYCENF